MNIVNESLVQRWISTLTIKKDCEDKNSSSYELKTSSIKYYVWLCGKYIWL